MSQLDFSPTTAATYVGVESTFGTTPAMTRCFPADAVTVDGLTQDNLVPQDERPRLFQALSPVQGFKGGSFRLPYYVRPSGTQYTSANAPVAHPLGELLRALMGGVANGQGSTVASGTTSSVTVGAGHGARFKIGQWCAVESSGSVLTPRRITNIATDTLTVRPNWAAPTTSGAVINSDTYYLTQQNSQTLTVQHAKADSQAGAFQWTMNGCRGSLDLAFERGQFARATANLDVGTWTGPSAQGISVAAAADAMLPAMILRNCTTLLQSNSATTSTHYAFKSFGFSLAVPTEYQPEYGGVEGKTSAQRSGSRPAVTATLRMRADLDLDNASSAFYASQTKLSVVLICPIGTGTSQRFIVVDIPTCQINAKPKQVGGSFMDTELSLHCLEDETTTTAGLSGTNLDLAVSPVRIVLL